MKRSVPPLLASLFAIVALLSPVDVLAQEKTAPAADQPVEGKWYMLFPRQNVVTSDDVPSGYMLGVRDAKAESSSPIVLRVRTGEDDQLFKFVPVKDGWYKIVPKLNKFTEQSPKGLVVGVCDAKVENRTAIILCEDTGHDSQLFKFVPVEYGAVYHKIVPKLNVASDKASKGFVWELCDNNPVKHNPIVLCEESREISQLFLLVPARP